MNVLLIYDSLYGNTKAVAEAVREALPGAVAFIHHSDADPARFQEYDLIILGGPTHGGGPSEDLKGLLERLQPSDVKGPLLAVFDTRLPWVFLRPFGYAAPKIARRLQELGGKVIGDLAGFIVSGGEGPLEEGELERATGWAKSVAADYKELAEARY